MAAQRQEEEAEVRLPAAEPPATLCASKVRSGWIRVDREDEGRRGPAAAAESAAGLAVKGEGMVNRCFGCRRKVGLTGGYRCRCGEMFCGEHRYSDRHVCGYDYKSAGREAIARDNPLVRAAKIVRI